DFGFGVDQGGHLAFTEQLVEQQQWPLRPDALSFFIRPDYPPGAHLLGAAIGAMFGSSIKGMFVALGLAFVSIYCSVFYLTGRTIAPATWIAVVIFALVIILLSKFRLLFGNEIVAEFFYAQFVATGIAMPLFIILGRMRTNLLGLACAAGAVYFCAWFFTL